METDLMGGPFELRKLPKGFSADFSVHKVLDIVKYGIIRHGAFHNILFMWMPQTAGHNEIQPLL